MHKQKIIKKYLHEIHKQFSICPAKEKTFLHTLENEIKTFAEQTDNLDYRNLVEHFGEPSDLVKDYISEETPDILKKRLSFTRHIHMIVIIIIFFALVCTAIFIGIRYKIYQETQNSYIHREIITIEEETT